jgi:hypothetical protein
MTTQFESLASFIEKYSMPDSFYDLQRSAAVKVAETWWEALDRACFMAAMRDEDLIAEIVWNPPKFTVNVYPAKGLHPTNPSIGQRAFIDASKAKAVIKRLFSVGDRG